MKRYIIPNVVVLFLWVSVPMWAQEPTPGRGAEQIKAAQSEGEIARTLAGQGQLVNVPANGRVKQSVKKDAPSFALPTGESRAVLFKLPDYSAPYTVTITSPCNHGCVGFSKSIFVPSGVFLDAEFQPTRWLPKTEFEFLEPGFSKAFRLEAKVLIDEPRKGDRYLLLYTIGGDVGSVVRDTYIGGLIPSLRHSKVTASADGSLELEARPARPGSGAQEKTPARPLASQEKAEPSKSEEAERLFDRGTELLKKRNLDEAITDFRKALELKPDFPDALSNLGGALSGKGDQDGAIAAYQKALELRPNDPADIQNLGIVLRHKGQFDEAIALYRKAIQLKPDFPGPYYSLGAALLAKGQYDEAITAFRKVLELQANYILAPYGLGAALLAKGQLDDAVAAFRKAPLKFKLKPNDAESLWLLSDTLLDLDSGLRDAAIVVLRRAFQLKPDHENIPFRLARQLMMNGQTQEAIATLRQAKATDYGNLFPPGHDDATVLSNFGWLLLGQRGFPNEAIAAFRNAIELKPDYADAYYNLGVALSDKGQYDEAIAANRKAIELKPDYTDAYYNLGIALFDKGQYDEAIAAYRKALELKPDYALAYNNLGNTLLEKGQYDEAIASLRKAIELKPDYALAHRNLGRALMKKGDRKAAERELAEAQRLDRKRK
jgi:tetratricopeptide (TPR) repeat protein